MVTMGDTVSTSPHSSEEGIAKSGAICLSEDAYWQVKLRSDLAVSDLCARRFGKSEALLSASMVGCFKALRRAIRSCWSPIKRRHQSHICCVLYQQLALTL